MAFKYREGLVEITRQNIWRVELNGRHVGMFSREELLQLYSGIARVLHIGAFKIVLFHTAAACGVTERDILGRSKKGIIPWARHVATWICAKVVPNGNAYMIGNLMGRHHGNTVNSIKVVNARMETEPEARAQVAAILEKVVSEMKEPRPIELRVL